MSGHGGIIIGNTPILPLSQTRVLELLAFLALVLAAAIAIAAVVRALRMPRARGSLAAAGLWLARWMIAAVLAASGALIVLTPRADQPFLDAVERAFPAVRSAYLDKASREPSREERDAAREHHRWGIGGVMVLLALSLVVSLPSRRTTPRNFGGEGRSTGA